MSLSLFDPACPICDGPMFKLGTHLWVCGGENCDLYWLDEETLMYKIRSIGAKFRYNEKTEEFNFV